jgi:uncharacterized protein (DUF3084 family)
MSGYLLILAIICLGGAIATIGDRLGSRVGKARLSLFKMRPKQTAVVVTILTGSIISSLTLGILLATSRQLRDGLIRIDEISQKSRQAQLELKDAIAQKQSAEQDLEEAQDDLDTVVDRLRNVRGALRKAVQKQQESEKKLKQLQSKFNQAQSKLEQTEIQARGLRSQITQLSGTSRRLKQEQVALITQRNAAQKNLGTANEKRIQLEDSVKLAQGKLNDVELQKRNLEQSIVIAQSELEQAKIEQAKSQQELSEAESRLASANSQRTDLIQEIQNLAENRKRLEQNVLNLLVGLRQGNIAIRAGQVLSSGVIERVNSRSEALQAINELLSKARIEAIVRTDPPDASPNRAVIFILPEFVERLIETILDGRSHYVRILSANNYLQREENINVVVIPQVLENQLIFSAGEALSGIEFAPTQFDEATVISKVESLFVLAKQRAIQQGMPPDPITGEVGEFSTYKLFKFATALKLADTPASVQVYTVAQNDTFTSGPLLLKLVAIQDNQLILSSDSF